MKKSSIEKVYVKDDQFVISCPLCDKKKTIPATNFKGLQHTMKIRCRCGHDFSLQMEFRRHPRKETFLNGDYTLERPSSQESGHTKVINLSLQGACFEVRGFHDITPDMEGDLVFVLDDKERTLLFRKVIIRSVRGAHIGCEFLDPDESCEKLSKYLGK